MKHSDESVRLYLDRLVKLDSYDDEEWNALNKVKTRVIPIVENAFNKWKWNAIRSDNQQLVQYIHEADGLWSDKYGSQCYSTNQEGKRKGSQFCSLEPLKKLRVVAERVVTPTKLLLFVEMPKQWFTQSDILNYRYHDKRKLFLASLGWCLSMSHVFNTIKLVPWTIGKRVLQMEMKQTATIYHIVIFPCLEQDTFDQSKLYSRKNVHSDEYSSTNYYNMTILEDVLLSQVVEKVSYVERENNEWHKASCLLQRWYLCFHAENIKSVLVDPSAIFLSSIWFSVFKICSDSQLAAQYRRWKLIQIVRYLLRSLEEELESIVVQKNWTNVLSPIIFLCSYFDWLPVNKGMNNHHLYGELVHVARNIQYFISMLNGESTMQRLFLENEFAQFPVNSFYPLCSYDMFVSLQVSTQSNLLKVMEEKEYFSIQFLLYYAKCHWLLMQALYSRCSYITLIRVHRKGTLRLILGCRLNAKDAFRLVERATNEEERKHFQSFWPEKTQLRRFRDGSVVESIVWEPSKLHHDGLFHDICSYVLSREPVILPIKQVEVFCSSLETLLPCTSNDKFASIGSHSCVIAFEKLSIILHNDMFRGTSVILPDTWTMQSSWLFVDAPYALIVVENNSQWPVKDSQAQHDMRIAYALAIRKSLFVKGIECCVGEEGLDVLFEDYIYHFEILTQDEYTRALGNHHVVYPNIAIRSQLHYFLKHLIEGENEYPSFREACRLAKRWLSCQLFSDYFSDEMIELLVADAYIKGTMDGCPPSSGLAGFCMFLKTLSMFSVDDHQLIVYLPVDDESNSVKETDHSFLRVFDRWNEMPISIQKDAFIFVRRHHYLYPIFREEQGVPCRVILKRIGQVAKAALLTLQQRLFVDMLWSLEKLVLVFIPDWTWLDVVISLRKRYVPRRMRYSVDACLQSIQRTKETKSIPLESLYVNIDPVSYFVHQLRQKFHSFAWFFYDQFGGDQIGICWKPLSQEAQMFSLKNMPWTRPDKQGNMELNCHEILSNIKEMGGNWIKKITCHHPTTA